MRKSRNYNRVRKVIKHMNRKPTDYKKEGWKCMCDDCSNIQEYTEDFKCKKCGYNHYVLVRFFKKGDKISERTNTKK